MISYGQIQMKPMLALFLSPIIAGLLGSLIPIQHAQADGLEKLDSVEVDNNESITRIEELDFSPTAVEARIANTVRFLSSDKLEGRGVGKQGLATAAQYIANQFAAAQLRTSFWDDLPYQYFSVDDMISMTSTENNRLQLLVDDTAQTLQLDQDFRPISVGGNGAFEGSVVFVGYGISASGSGWKYDEYQDVDVKGKVVVMFRKEPRQADEASPFDGTRTSSHSLFTNKLATARRRGAAAVLFANDFVSIDDGNGQTSDILPSIDTGGKPDGRNRIPAMFVSRSLVERMIQVERPGLTLNAIESAIETSLEPQSFELTKVRLAGDVELTQQKQMTCNVVASLEGQGALANEAVVIGAHYDHVGMGEYGSLAPGVYDIHNGADDNASGTSALLELGRKFSAASSARPADYRRIIFIAFSAEEKGLLGSKYYVKHPVQPIETTTAMVNMDMIGRLGSNRLIVYGVGSSPTFGSLVEVCASKKGLTLNLQQPAMGPSDHEPFFQLGIPVLHFFTGTHPNYHRPSDDFDKINTTGIVRITDMVYQVIDQLAREPDRPTFVRVPGRVNIQIRSEEHGSLGIRLRGDLQSATIASVEPEGPAAVAGLLANDQVIALNKNNVQTVNDLLEAIRSYSPKESVTITVIRDQVKLEIPVILGHY
jgi:hypothetical protein